LAIESQNTGLLVTGRTVAQQFHFFSQNAEPLAEKSFQRKSVPSAARSRHREQGSDRSGKPLRHPKASAEPEFSRPRASAEPEFFRKV
jgi:hypothetical protein